MKKRVFILCLTLSLLLGLLPTAALAAEHKVTEVPIQEEVPQIPPEEDNTPAELTATGEWITVPGIEGGQICFDSTTGTITNCETTVTTANIPTQINGVAVTSIGAYAFLYCRDLKTVTIPNGCKTIGNRAFEECTSLSRISIPDSVTDIREYAFGSCHSLTDITIPKSIINISGGTFNSCISLAKVTMFEGVQSIGHGAFYGCYNLFDVAIPNSVVEIERSAFEGCDALSSIVIPNSVTSIGDCAFKDCPSLTSVEISNGVINLESGAFSGCTSLTSITIPDSIEHIGENPFEFCSALSRINVSESNLYYCDIDGVLFNKEKTALLSYPGGKSGIYQIPQGVKDIECAFRGCHQLRSVVIPNGVTCLVWGTFTDCTSLASAIIPDSIITIDLYVFSHCNNLQDVYYGGDSAQWSDMIWYDGVGYEELISAKIHYNSTGPIIVADGKYLFQVVDEKGKNIRGATVTWNDEAQATDSKGLATFDLLTVGEPTVAVSKDGYLTWTNADSNWTKSPDCYEMVILYPEALGAYKLAVCYYSSSSLMTMAKNVLTTTKTVSLGNEISSAGNLDDEEFYLSCMANDPSNVDHYELWQGSQKIAQESVGFFSLSTDQFKDGGGCVVRVVSKDGDKVETRINLQFKTAKLNKASSISWGGKSVNFKVDDNVPFLGGSTFTANLPIQLPITFLAGDDKLQIGLNVNATGGKTEKEQLKAVKDLLRYTKQAGSLQLGKLNSQQKKIFQSLVKKSNDLKFFKNGRIDALGYLECNWGSSTATGQLMIQGSISPVKFGYTAWVMIVPATANITLSLDGAAVSEISYDWANATFLGTVDLDVSAELTAFGGLGVQGIMGGGGYGSAELAGGYRFESLDGHTGWKDIDLTGELGLKAYLGDLEYKRPFVYNTWHLYTSDTVKAASLMSAEEHWQAGLFSAEDYHAQDLSYLGQESGWLGDGGTQAQLFATNGAATTLTPLLTDTYRNARPVMAAGDDGLYATFLRADATGGNIYAAVTKYDGSTWGTPIRVDSGAVLDSTPTLCADGSGTLWLAYARTAVDVDKTSLSSYAQKQTIAVGTLDPNTLAFTQKAEFPSADYAHMPKLAVIGGVPTLAWMDSPVTGDDSVLWPASATVYTSTWDGTTWSAAIAAETVDKPVTQLILGEKDGQRALAYVADEDGNPTTQEDQSLYVNGTLIAQGVFGTVTLAQAPGMSGADYMWNGEGCLAVADGTQIPASGISNEYAVTGSRIYYSAAGAAEQGGAHLTTVLYDDGAWSEAVTLTSGERYLENLSVVTWNGQDYLMGMDTLAEITETDVNDAKNLVWAEVMPSSDLRLDGLDYSTEGLVPGENVTVTITVTNAGDHSVDSIDMALGDDHWTENCQLAPGESLDITHTVTCPSALTDYTVSAVETDWEDFTPEDNTATLALGYAQLSVELKEQRVGTSQALVAVVTNTGIDSDSGILRFTNEAGEVLDEVELSTLAAGDSEIVTYPAQLPNGDYTATLLCGEKSLYADDTDTIHVERYCEIISTQVADNTLTASVIGEAGATAYCAFYDVDGRMLQVVSEPLEAGAAEMSFPAPASADHGKVFLLSSQQFPLCPAVQALVNANSKV